MDNETVEALGEQSGVDFTAGNLPPESPLPQPGFEWLEQAGNVAAEPPPVSAGFASHQKRPAQQMHIGSESKRFGFLSRRASIKAITALGVVGIAVLIYVEFSSDKSAVADMLGTELIKFVPESAPVPDSSQGPVDPRLADPVALEMLRLENEPQATNAIAAVPGDSLMGTAVPSEESPEVALPQAGLPAETLAQPQLPATEPATATSIAPAVSTAPDPALAPGVTNEELMLRLQRVELLLAQLQLQAKAAATAPATTPAASSTGTAVPAATTQRRAEPAARPAPARTVKATPPKPVKQAKAPASAPAPVLGGQLVSVDMWNGEASVVIASGLPGDRRVRVLRPGDVVNGMALRSADPVTRSATFVAPGSQGLTLYVSQGG